MAEWSIAPVLKTGDGLAPSVGSNPTPSARLALGTNGGPVKWALLSSLEWSKSDQGGQDGQGGQRFSDHPPPESGEIRPEFRGPKLDTRQFVAPTAAKLTKARACSTSALAQDEQ